jgi:pimeloyl-ACP methyl ester carboxylesterase
MPVWPTFAFLIVFYFILRPLALGYRYARPSRVRVMFFTPTSLGVSYEAVLLDGWYVPSHNGAAIILQHAHGGNRLGMIPHAEALLRAGYGVLMLDLRAHGKSGGNRFGRSSLFVNDILTAVAYLRKRPDVNAAGIGICGISAGAMFALHAAAKTVAIRAIVADRPAPATMKDMPPPKPIFEQFIAWPMQNIFMRFGQYFGGLPPLPATVDIVSRIAPRPILFIVGRPGFEQRIGEHIFAQAKPQKQLWEMRAKPFSKSESEHVDQYGQQIVQFFNRYLRLDIEEAAVE